MSLIVLPKTLTGHTPAIAAEVMADLNAIVARVNGNLAADNLAADAIETAKILDAAVTTPKLADGSVTPAKLSGGSVLSQLTDHTLPLAKILTPNISGSIPIAQNGVGEFAAHALSGAVGLNPDGSTALGSRVYNQSNPAVALAIDGTSWLDVSGCSAFLAAGDYVVWGKVRLDSTANYQAQARLFYNGTALDTAQAAVTQVVNYSSTLSLIGGFTSDGIHAISLQAVVTSLSGSPEASYGRLAVLRTA